VTRRRVCWMLWLFGAAVLHWFGNNAGTFTVLFASIVVPVLLAALGSFAAGSIRVTFDMPRDGTKNEPFTGVLHVQNAGFFPVQRAVCRVTCTNALTGAGMTRVLPFSLPPKGKTDIRFDLVSSHCGRLTVTTDHLRTGDVFGLFERSIAFHAEHGLWIRPSRFPVNVSLPEQADAIADSDEYSMTQPGYDPSETYAIRAYIPGDPIRSIHWKLSQKADTLLTRELGLPVVRRMLLLLETTILGTDTINADAMDAAAEVFASVSSALCGQGVAHTLGYRDAETGALREWELADEDTLAMATEGFLTSTFTKGGNTVAARFRDAHELCAYAHVVVVAVETPPDLDLLRNGNRVTALVCNGEPAWNGYQPDGTYAFAFSTENYAIELDMLEL